MKNACSQHLNLAAVLLIGVFLSQGACAQTTQYGSIQDNDENFPGHTSFRLKRPTPPPSSPQITQSADSMSSVATPDLTTLYPQTQDGAQPASRSSTTWRPGVILTGSLGDQALNPTCDLGLARQQADAFPTSPEAAFIYAVALTKTSQVEVALKEVRRARNLAQATGDPDYFSRAVGQYEQTLDADQDNTCIRYALGWAYYMQAYLFAEKARKQERLQQIMAGQAPVKRSKVSTDFLGGASILSSVLTGTRPVDGVVPHIPGALENTPSWAQPQIRLFYQKCLAALEGVEKRDPRDVWASVYAVHVREEYDDNHPVALSRLEALKKAHPDNPAAAFFLAEAYARNGNVLAGASTFSQALGLKMQGK